MKKQSFNTSLFTSINEKDLATLTTQIKETIAFGFINRSSNFTTADLWNIQRQAKPRNQRRYL